MNIEYTSFKAEHCLEWDDGFNNCLLFNKKEGSTLYNFLTGQHVNLDFNPCVSSLIGNDKANEVWLEYCTGKALKLFNFNDSSFIKSFNPIEGLDWCSRSTTVDFILAMGSGIFYVFDINSEKVITEDLLESEHEIKVSKNHFVDFPRKVFSKAKDYFRVFNFETKDESSHEIQINNQGVYRFIDFLEDRLIYLYSNLESLVLYNIEGQVLKEITFKRQANTSIIISVVGSELYTLTKEGRKQVIRKFDKDGNELSENTIEVESVLLKKDKDNPVLFKAQSYRDFIWLEDSIINVNDFSVEILNLPDTIDWNFYDYKISENGAFLIGLINPKSEEFDKFVLGSFEEGLIHANFKNCSEITVI